MSDFLKALAALITAIATIITALYTIGVLELGEPETPSIPQNPSPAEIPAPSPTQLLPSGTIMRQCGCWGPFPNQIASEPRCVSGKVRVQICSGFCTPPGDPRYPPGHPEYLYVCT